MAPQRDANGRFIAGTGLSTAKHSVYRGNKGRSKKSGTGVQVEITRKSERALYRRLGKFNDKIRGTIMRKGLLRVGTVLVSEIRKGMTAAGGGIDRSRLKRMRMAVGKKAFVKGKSWMLKVGANVGKKGKKAEPMTALFTATKGMDRVAENWMGLGFSHSTGRMAQDLRGVIPDSVNRAYNSGSKVEAAFLKELNKQIGYWNKRTGK